jgi:hypothetical protein
MREVRCGLAAKLAIMTTKFDFSVYSSEPIMRFLVALGATPVRLAIGFFLLVSLTLTGGALLSAPEKSDLNFLTYPKNISWSVPILVIWPLIIGLILHLNIEIPRLFLAMTKFTNERDHEKYARFATWIEKRFNSYGARFIIFLIAVPLNGIYYVQLLDTPEHSWISDGTILKERLGTMHGFSLVGLYSAFIQTLLSYLMLNLTWTSLIFAWGLRRYFNIYRFNINVEPLHPDGCCGLKRIGDVAMIINIILFLFGIYLSLKVIDKIVIQGFPIWVDIGNPVLLAGYAILAPIMFFLPLNAAHKVMLDEKQRLLMTVAKTRSAQIRRLEHEFSTDLVADIAKVGALFTELNRQIPVWPFNFRSLESFFGTIVVPILPILLPFLVKFLIDFTGTLLR